MYVAVAKNKVKMLLLPSCVIALTLLQGQSAATPGEDPKALQDEFWQWRLREFPLFASSAGDSRYDANLESYEYDIYAERRDDIADFISRAQRVNTDLLDQKERMELDIFTSFLQTFVDGAKWTDNFATNPVSFMETFFTYPSYMQYLVSFSTFTDFVNYKQRLISLETQIFQMMHLLHIAVSQGTTLNIVSVAPVIEMIEATLRTDAYYSPAFTYYLDQAQNISDENKLALRADAQSAVNRAKGALTVLKNYLLDTYIPASRPQWGIYGWPNGKEAYKAILRYHTSTDMTPEQVHNLGLREVSRIQGEMYKVLQRLGFSGTIKEFFEAIRKDPRFFFTSSDELLAAYKSVTFNTIYPELSKYFNHVPSRELQIKQMPYDGPLGMYYAPSYGGTDPGVFYANVFNPEEKSTLGMMALLLHETCPGHHFQISSAMERDIPIYRALLSSDPYYRMPVAFPINTAYLEGWGLYAEYLGEEMGMYTNDYMLMGRYSYEILRACRLVVDTGIHYYGWERNDAVQYMLDNTAESEGTLTNEVDRYITIPGQATAYKIGEIKIRELRTKAENALGGRFQLKDFHSVILDNGAIPLDVLERFVDAWIAEQGGGGGGSESESEEESEEGTSSEEESEEDD